jgi:NAD(P)H dehydrogenase (quinone)
MRVLIVFAHPEPKSFNAALKDTAVSLFAAQGHEVKVSDLYTMGFDPVGGKKDFTALGDPDFFKYQAEQVNAWKNDLFVPEVKAEMEKLEWADLVIFNFPLWWFSLPAILKGWVDRVFAMGFCYGAGKGVYENGTYRGKKKGMLTITTGGPEIAYGDNGKNGDIDKIIYHIQHGMLYFVGMDVLPPFIAWSPARLTDEERKKHIENYTAHLQNLDKLEPVAF